MNLKIFESDPMFRENTYLLISGGEALLIDPGADPDLLIAAISEPSLTLRAVLATHGHVDHILTAKPLCDRFECPFMMSSADQEWLANLEEMCRHFGLPYYGTPVLDRDLAKTDRLALGAFSFHILPTPGHSPGSLCFLNAQMLFSGDTLFHRSVGRCDLPGGNMTLLKKSIKEKILPLPDETVVYPGHMEKTSVGSERKNNPYITL
jgi:hydroxyacylglutathione hydrolase